MTTNPIAIGFDWRQAFDFPAGFFQVGDAVRAEFRHYPSDGTPLATATTRIEGNRLFLELAATQTAAMQKMAKMAAITNFVVERGDEEIAIGVIVTVPVVLLPTRPRA